MQGCKLHSEGDEGHALLGLVLKDNNLDKEMMLGGSHSIVAFPFNNYHTVLEFNLGPLHKLKDVAQKIFELRHVEYPYRRTPSGALSTHFSRLRNHEEGAAVDTFRKLGEERAHLPTRIWS